MPQFKLNIPIAKTDQDAGTVTGWAALSRVNGQPIIDHQNDVLMLDGLKAAAQKLVTDGGKGKAGEMHERIVGDVVESMVFDSAKAKALGLGDGAIEGWAVTLKIHDAEARARIKNGERLELSISGSARTQEIGKRDGLAIKAMYPLDIGEISIVDHGASGNDDVAPRIVIAKRKGGTMDNETLIQKIKQLFSKEAASMNLDEILAGLPEEQRNVILAALEQSNQPQPQPAPQPQPQAEPMQMAEPAPAAEAKPEDEEELKKEELPEAVRKRLDDGDKAKGEVVELRKRLDAIEEQAKLAAFCKKAESMPYLVGASTEQVGKLLKAVDEKLDKAEAEAVIKMLATANDTIQKSGLLVDVGSDRFGGGDDANAKLNEIAKQIVKEENISFAKAHTAAVQRNPDLFRALRQ